MGIYNNFVISNLLIWQNSRKYELKFSSKLQFVYSLYSDIMLPVALRLRIDWSEMDLFGHVNNVAFMKYVQAARVNYWELIGLSKMHEREKKGPMLASTSCAFLKPLFYPGQVEIRTSLEFMKTTSFGLRHWLLNEKEELAAEAHDVVVMYDFNAQSKMEIPNEIRMSISSLEGTKK